MRVGDRIQTFNPSSLVDGKIVVEVELSLMQLYVYPGDSKIKLFLYFDPGIRFKMNT